MLLLSTTEVSVSKKSSSGVFQAKGTGSAEFHNAAGTRVDVCREVSTNPNHSYRCRHTQVASWDLLFQKNFGNCYRLAIIARGMKSEIALAEGRGVTGAALAADDSINNVNK